MKEVCGDDIINNGEECDDGNTEALDGCSEICVTEYCGDGTLNNDGAEQCDDGNSVGGDGCSSECIKEICGDN